jgi:hypothetical protein
MTIPTVRIGDSVNYCDPVDSSVIHRATCVGHGRKNSERIVYLDDGHWCYLHQVVGIANSMKRQRRQRSSSLSESHVGDLERTGLAG